MSSNASTDSAANSQCLSFKRSPTISTDTPLSDHRDYGLMRTVRSMTPYPWEHLTVSPNIVRQHLVHERSSISILKHYVEPEEPPLYATKSPDASPTSSMKSLNERTIIFGSVVSNTPGVPPTPCDRQHIKIGKKVVIICPWAGILRSASSQHSIGSHKESFAERRRSFNMAEFTIAKNGKKMCDILMTNTNPLHINNSDYHITTMYNEEVEKLIKSSGFKKAFYRSAIDRFQPDIAYPSQATSLSSSTKLKSILIEEGTPQELRSVSQRNISFVS
ncbi:uncharacterized protein LOC111604280 [Drosophila hydei]|uniref:Uncharacterized protein LOC111604280 n=1 Tax=Drosophila hydei TaxID=7224 RepID=A0A6J1MBS1_DROHY|nr:uncharacterized protein LOC111604280 [Drosophila hydei]